MARMLASRDVRSDQNARLMSAPSLLIAGAGDLGSRLALLRAARGDEVIALRRRDHQVAGARLLRADLGTGEGLQRLPRQVQALVVCVAPDQRDEATYRRLYRDGLRRLLDATDASRVIFVSSTAVYGQDAGEWVTETSPTQPAAFNGRVLLEAEAELAAHAQGTALRLSGIYGPGREAMLRRAREGAASGQHWTNRIHIDDAAAALSHLLDLDAPQRLYLGNDDRPALEHEVQDWVRAQEGLPPVAASDGAVSGRRVANTRLRGSGWVPAHPDFRSGYSSLLYTPGL
jgi:nucleoside-diphosphate-sugar epimerase